MTFSWPSDSFVRNAAALVTRLTSLRLSRILRLGPLLLLLSCSESRAETLPEYRPALMQSRHALINLIDTKALVRKGQKDAVILFTARVSSVGRGGNILIYRGTPGSELLGRELLRRNSLAVYVPAVSDHRPVDVQIIGTVVFVVRNGEPHLRIFLNQEEEDLKKPSDFVAPQLTSQLHLNPDYGLPVPSPTPPWHKTGVALLTLEIDAKGQVQKAAVAYEHPAGVNFGASAAAMIRYGTFIPGFRDGKAVACRFTWPVLFVRDGKTKLE